MTRGMKVGDSCGFGRVKLPPCDCEGCTSNRFSACEVIERQIEAKRAAGKLCPPVMPFANAPTTTKLQ